MTDRILVSRIAIYAFHGLHPEEERLGQRFFVSLEVHADLREAGKTDDYRKTVCYARLTEIVTEVGTNRRFRIIEALAEAIAQEILAALPKIERIVVRVEKPAAPIPAIIDNVSVEISRTR